MTQWLARATSANGVHQIDTMDDKANVLEMQSFMKTRGIDGVAMEWPSSNANLLDILGESEQRQLDGCPW